jgi:hypothetical protein
MSDVIFVPITCAHCRRTSAVRLSLSELQESLNSDREIILRCGFDGNTWDAGVRERARLTKLCQENEAVVRGNLFRRNPISLRHGA